MERYKYERLPNEDYIRLLFVEPIANADDDIHCYIRTFPMDREQPYLALSYSWATDNGDASFCERILVDGKVLNITRNLFHGLHRIFAGNETRLPIWIDAVCIDQSNVDERSSQVARMGQIYSNASEVLCWLGNGESKIEDDNTAAVLACLGQRRHSHFREHRLILDDGSTSYACLYHAAETVRTASEWYPWQSGSHVPECIKALFPSRDLKASVMEVQAVLAALYSKRYWSRTWIVQEICMATGPVLFLYSDHIWGIRELATLAENHNAVYDWYYLNDFGDSESSGVESCENAEGEESDGDTRILELRNIFELRDMFVKASECDLTESVQSCHELETTDPRDRVYALLSLDPRTSIRPDYRNTTAEVYVAFSTHVLAAGHCLPSLLASVAAQTSRFPTDDELRSILPSWCLDLRVYFMLLSNSFGPAIKTWEIDRSNVLTCSALKFGFLSDDILEIQPFASSCKDDGSRVSDQQFLTYPVDNLFGRYRMGYSRPRDLVCIFHTMNERQANESYAVAVVLRPVLGEEKTYRIVGELKFYHSGWRAGTYPVETIRIR